MHYDVVNEIFEQYKEILGDYRELLIFTQSLEPDTQYENIKGFMQERERLVDVLQQKEAVSISLREAACRELGINTFTLDNLSSKVPEVMLEGLSKVICESIKVAEDIQQFTARLNQTLQMELENTKLNLQRLQSINRLRHTYQPGNLPEARFIDKTK